MEKLVLENFGSTLQEKLKEAEEVKIAVGLLNDKGIDLVFENCPEACNIKFLVGIDLPTPPQTLQKLNELQKNEWFAARIYSFKPFFHPKIYLIRNKDDYNLFVGSANCTQAGFSGNIEASIFSENPEMGKQTESWFEETFLKCPVLSNVFINQYLSDFENRKDSDIDKNFVEKGKKRIQRISNEDEPSFHFPQGTHLGHLFYILNILYKNIRSGSYLDEEHVAFGESYGSGRKGTFRRQVKYKLQGAMELGLVQDYRVMNPLEGFNLKLTPKGNKFFEIIKPLIEEEQISLEFKKEMSWDMKMNEREFNHKLKSLRQKIQKEEKEFVDQVFLYMDAISLLLNFVYKKVQEKSISKTYLYHHFFEDKDVINYHRKNGLKIPPSMDGRRRRVPFLLNLLESIDVLDQNSTEIEIKKFIVYDRTMNLKRSDTSERINERITAIEGFINEGHEIPEDIASELKNYYGEDFPENSNFFNKLKVLDYAQ